MTFVTPFSSNGIVLDSYGEQEDVILGKLAKFFVYLFFISGGYHFVGKCFVPDFIKGTYYV